MGKTLRTNSRTPLKLEITQRREKIVEAVKSGSTIAEAAALVGISRSQAHRDFNAALELLPAQNLEMWRRVQHAQLLEAKRMVLGKVRAGVLGAVDRLVLLCEREAKLLGLDAPAQASLLVGVTQFDPATVKSRLDQLLSDETPPVAMDGWYSPPQPLSVGPSGDPVTTETGLTGHDATDTPDDDTVVVVAEVEPTALENTAGTTTTTVPAAVLEARAHALETGIITTTDMTLGRPGFASHGW